MRRVFNLGFFNVQHIPRNLRRYALTPKLCNTQSKKRIHQHQPPNQNAKLRGYANPNQRPALIRSRCTVCLIWSDKHWNWVTVRRPTNCLTNSTLVLRQTARITANMVAFQAPWRQPGCHAWHSTLTACPCPKVFVDGWWCSRSASVMTTAIPIVVGRGVVRHCLGDLDRTLICELEEFGGYVDSLELIYEDAEVKYEMAGEVNCHVPLVYILWVLH